MRPDTQDEIFIICNSNIDEFGQYITKMDDIIGKYESRFISPAYRNLNLDAVRERSNGDLVHFEHFSHLPKDLLTRGLEYFSSLKCGSLKVVHPFILIVQEYHDLFLGRG